MRKRTSSAFLLATILLSAGPPASRAQKSKTSQQEVTPQHRFVDDPIAELIADIPELAKLKTPAGQEELPEILSNVADRATAFAHSVVSVAGREEVKQQLLFPNGKVRKEYQSTFSYDVRFNEVHPEGTEAAIWVPLRVTVTTTQAGQRLRNFHEYSQWRVFRVSVQIKPGAVPQ